MLKTILFVLLFPQLAIAQLWDSLDCGLSYVANVLYADSTEGELYVGGSFSWAGNIEVDGIAVWDGIKWDSLGTGLDRIDGSASLSYTDRTIHSIEKFNGNLYVAGNFDSIGGIYSPRIARWNGTSWESIITAGIDGTILKLKEIDNRLYVLGAFETINGIQSPKIAMWNDSNWLPFPVSLSLQSGWLLSDIVEYDNELYVTGNFVSDSNLSIKDIAKWDGTKWDAVGVGLTGSLTHGNSLTVYQNKLYLAGYFFENSGDPGNCLIIWDGNQWSNAGLGTDGQIFDLMVFNGWLWCVGQFSYAGGVPASFIAKWNGNEWCSLGSDFQNTPKSIEVLSNELFVAGSFLEINSTTMSRVSKWTGGTYTDSCRSTVGLPKINLTHSKIYPNPFTNSVNLEIESLESTSSLQVFLFDIQGKEILHKRFKLSNGLNFQALQLSSTPSGTYILSLEGEGFRKNYMLIKTY